MPWQTARRETMIEISGGDGEVKQESTSFLKKRSKKLLCLKDVGPGQRWARSSLNRTVP
jgi:hypothetical protein